MVRRSYDRFNGKTIFEANSKEAVQNYLIDNYIASITAPLQYAESKKPLDATTDYLKDRVLKDIDELSGNTTEKETSQLYYGTPSFQNQTKDDLISGKLHLGVFALATSHHSLAQSVGLAFKSNVISTKYNLLSLSSIDSQQPNYWDKEIITYTSISDWLSAMVNAHVDVAKDPYINRLNVRTLTLQMTAMLLRAGKGESTFYFLAQPALVQAAKEYEKNSGFYGAKKITPINQIRITRDLLLDEAAQLFGRSSEVYTKISEAAMLDLTPEEARNMFDIDYLRSIMPRSHKPEWFIGQLRVLKAFEEMHPFSKALSELTTISQIDTKKYGNNFALQQNFLIKISNFLRNSAAFVSPSAVIKNTFLREKLRAALINPRNIFSNSLLRVSRDFETRRALLYARTVGYDSERITDNVATTITRAMESNFKIKAIASYAKANGVSATDLLYGNNSIPRRLIKIKRLIQSGIFPELLKSDGTFENALLDNIDPMLKTTPVDFVLPDFLVFKANKSSDGNVDDLVIRAWEELLTFDTEIEAGKKEAEEIRRFARDLAIYAMYTSGDAFGKNNIFKYVPDSFRETSGYFDQIRQLEQDPSNYYNQLDDDNLIRNLWWNDEIVPQLDLYTTSYDEFGMETRSIRPNISADYSINGVNVPGLFTADFGEVKFLYTNKFGQPVFTPYVKLALGEKNDPRTTKLYKFVGYEQSETSNGRTLLRPVYKLVTKKGLNYKGKVVTEVIGSENSPSIVKINNESFNVDLPSLNIIPLTTNLPDPDKYKSIFDPIGVINKVIFDEGTTSKPSEPVSSSAPEDIAETPVQTIYVNHSGGAVGSDYYWGIIGEKYGVKSNHYWYKNITPNGNVEISEEDALEGQQKVTIAARQMGRIAPTHQVRDERLIRNWSQVKYSDAIFAVTTLLQVGDEMNYGKKALIVQGKGGTGYAIQMAINEGKPTYVYDQIRKRWYKNINGEWSETDTPTLTPNFAGIGTRELNEDGKRAIEGVYEKTFKFSQDFVDNVDKRVSESNAETTVQPITKLRAVDSVQQSLQFDAIEEAPITSSNRNTYTFSNGFSVTTPFKLNDQQERTLAKLNEFIDNKTEDSITLSGYAGTGKTTVISILDKYLKNRRIPTVYLAPTHRANAVTMMMNPNVSANTIHKFLGIRPDIDISNDTFDVSSISFDDTAFSTEGSGDLLIIDESSMIPDSLADILIQFASRSGKQIIFVGDSAQLKPVNNHGRISKIFREDNGEVIELTKVERTGDNAILEEATRLREGNDLTYNSKLNSRGEGVTYTNIRDELMSFISDNLKSAEFAADPLYFRILSATNEAILGYNRRAREILYGKDTARTEWLVPGELLMGYQNEKQDRKKEEIHNSFDYKVVKKKKDSRTLYGMQNSVKVDGYYTVLKDLFNPGINQKIFILDPNTPQKTLYEIADIIDSFYAQYKQLRNSGRSKEAKKVYASLMKFKQSFATMVPLYGRNGNLVKAKSLDYGYAHTIHKSQGGTYNKVVILGGTVNSFEDAQTRQQLKYVAITRAKERVMYSVPEGVKISNNITVMESNPTITELDKLGEQRKNECK